MRVAFSLDKRPRGFFTNRQRDREGPSPKSACVKCPPPNTSPAQPPRHNTQTERELDDLRKVLYSSEQALAFKKRKKTPTNVRGKERYLPAPLLPHAGSDPNPNLIRGETKPTRPKSTQRSVRVRPPLHRAKLDVSTPEQVDARKLASKDHPVSLCAIVLSCNAVGWGGRLLGAFYQISGSKFQVLASYSANSG